MVWLKETSPLAVQPKAGKRVKPKQRPVKICIIVMILWMWNLVPMMRLKVK